MLKVAGVCLLLMTPSASLLMHQATQCAFLIEPVPFAAADGVAKNRTSIAAGAFIGSNSTLVAPVTVGEGALIAAGSVITSDVPADGLALGRSRQTTKERRAEATREKLRAEHEQKFPQKQ